MARQDPDRLRAVEEKKEVKEGEGNEEEEEDQ